MDSLYPESDRIVNRVDGVSILRTLPGTDRKAATKVWRNGPDGPVKENFGMAARFDYEFQPCQNIRDLSLILKQLNNDPYAMVIRGELADGVDPRRVLGGHVAQHADRLVLPVHRIQVVGDAKARCPAIR